MVADTMVCFTASASVVFVPIIHNTMGLDLLEKDLKYLSHRSVKKLKRYP